MAPSLPSTSSRSSFRPHSLTSCVLAGRLVSLPLSTTQVAMVTQGALTLSTISATSRTSTSKLSGMWAASSSRTIMINHSQFLALAARSVQNRAQAIASRSTSRRATQRFRASQTSSRHISNRFRRSSCQAQRTSLPFSKSSESSCSPLLETKCTLSCLSLQTAPFMTCTRQSTISLIFPICPAQSL